MTNENLNYVAGFFDGEGSIGINKHKVRNKNKAGEVKSECTVYQIQSKLVNTNLELLTWIKKEFNDLGAIYEKPKYNKSHTQVYMWITSSRQAKEVLKLLQPYLRLKQKQAATAITFQESIENRKSNSHNPLTDDEKLERDRVWKYSKFLNTGHRNIES